MHTSFYDASVALHTQNINPFSIAGFKKTWNFNSPFDNKERNELFNTSFLSSFVIIWWHFIIASLYNEHYPALCCVIREESLLLDPSYYTSSCSASILHQICSPGWYQVTSVVSYYSFSSSQHVVCVCIYCICTIVYILQHRADISKVWEKYVSTRLDLKKKDRNKNWPESPTNMICRGKATSRSIDRAAAGNWAATAGRAAGNPIEVSGCKSRRDVGLHTP